MHPVILQQLAAEHLQQMLAEADDARRAHPQAAVVVAADLPAVDATAADERLRHRARKGPDPVRHRARHRAPGAADQGIPGRRWLFVGEDRGEVAKASPPRVMDGRFKAASGEAARRLVMGPSSGGTEDCGGAERADQRWLSRRWRPRSGMSCLPPSCTCPRRGSDLVPRPRLTACLDEGLVRGLVLVCAPAGYGKTVLLADWARRGGQPTAWLSLDAGDNDPARFWRHVVAALDQARPAGSANGLPRCSARPRRRRSRAW